MKSSSSNFRITVSVASKSITITKLKCRNANRDKVFANASNRLRHEKQANHRPKKNRAKQVVPNFDKEKGLFLLTFSYFFGEIS